MWKPCVHVHAAVPAIPMMGVRERNAMFTQSFFCCVADSLMTTPPSAETP
jgi:hypothetical protein